MKRLAFVWLLLMVFSIQGHAVLKEKDLEQTLAVLRSELTHSYNELAVMSDARREQNRETVSRLMETVTRSNQNALMLYSQKNNYVFDLTYACHEATELYKDFQQQQLPFRSFLESTDNEIAKYDSLTASLRAMPVGLMSQRARTDRSVCMTLATSLRNTLSERRTQINDYIGYYESTEARLKTLNDYANQRYNDIQTGIFRNGGDHYFYILRHLGSKIEEAGRTVADKYRPARGSQWDSRIILGLFVIIVFYVLVAVALNILLFRVLLPKRFHTEEFLRKRSCLIMATTTITFALIMAVARNVWPQNFLIMASDLLIEYAWLLGVILVSLLLRVSGEQIRSAFRIYAPLLVVGFLVISFRIVLIPDEIVNMTFPPILLVSTLWQWRVISLLNRRIPRQDMLYSGVSLAVFGVSTLCSWMGYTLLSVQILIWWVMQLTCILTITCLSTWIKTYGEKHGIKQQAITKTWVYYLIYKVVLPVLGVYSVMISVYWAANVFNLSDLCWQIFQSDFVKLENLQLSVLKLTLVISLWFVFSYLSRTLLDFLWLHYYRQDPSTAASRQVMSKNVTQIVVWGIWLLLSLAMLHVSVAWLLAISGGLSTGIGFASKNIIENIFYGASLMTGRMKVGDWIEVNGTMGQVTSISYTSTIIESLAGEVITFQNSQLFACNYKNLTKNHGYISVGVPFGVAYGSNLQEVQQIVNEAVNALKNPYTDPNHKASSVVVAMNDSSIDFKIYVWAEAVKKAAVTSEVLKCIYDTLNAHHIEIPFPQQEIAIKSN